MTDDEIDAVLDALIPDGTIIKRRERWSLDLWRAAIDAARKERT